MVFPSRMKAKWAAGQPVLTICLHFTDPSIYEMVGLMGWDAIWMDLEHHGYSLETAQQMMRAARVGGTDILARPAKGEFMRMGRILESGAKGILYPRCDSAAEAREVVRWSKFAPLGERGADGANPDNPYLLTGLAEYVKAANEQTVIVVQIEDEKVADRAEEIAAVEGIDAIFVGPGDMSVLAGIPGDIGHPRMTAAIEKVAKAARNTGKRWGMPAGSPARIKELLDMGASLINYGSDFTNLLASFRRIQEEVSPLGFKFTPHACVKS